MLSEEWKQPAFLIPCTNYINFSETEEALRPKIFIKFRTQRKNPQGSVQDKIFQVAHIVGALALQGHVLDATQFLFQGGAIRNRRHRRSLLGLGGMRNKLHDVIDDLVRQFLLYLGGQLRLHGPIGR